MAKDTIADKLAKKTYASEQFQKSWAVHMQAFGPILEPAFAEDYQARVHLCAVLNQISNRNIAQGLAKLRKLENLLVTDADKTAYLFFMGLINELTGNQEQMLTCYTYANEYGHSFYMPYMKVAQFYLKGHLYDRAEKNYRDAIACFRASGLDGRDRLILGSAYANLASCLIMMHRYEEAGEALESSRSLYPDGAGRKAAEAVLHAIQGREAEARTCLDALKAHAPEAYGETLETVQKILDHSNPMFYPVALDEEKINGFWNWFGQYAATLRTRLDQEEYEAGLSTVAEHLLEAFPFMEETPYLALGKNEKGYVIELRDMYIVAIMDAYDKLLQACPEELRSDWEFVAVH